MLRTREKLAEIVGQIRGCSNEPCMTCDFYKDGDKCVRRHNEFVADQLIANGVRLEEKQATSNASEQFASDNHVGGKWIPVTERLPEEKDYYLCCVKSFLFPGRTYVNILKCDKDGFMEGNIYTDDVTHWMPLPEPPKGE